MIPIRAEIEGSLTVILQAEAIAGARAVQVAVAAAGARVKNDWRGQVQAAGLGSRLAYTIRGEVYPKGHNSLSAAALVYTKAPKIIGAHESGALIRANGGQWLAIPLPAAGVSGGGRITPGEWQFKTGRKLTFIQPRGSRRSALLVAEDVRENSRRLAVRSRRKRRRDGIKTGETTIPVFILIRQARLPKRLNLMGRVEAVAGNLPGQIVSNWRS